MTPADMKPLHDSGLSDDAIRDAIRVAVMFTIATSTADVFDFHVPDAEEQKKHVDFLFKRTGIRKFLFR